MALPSDADLRSLPKVELHVHVEGSISAVTALSLARRYRVDPRELGLVGGRYPDRFDNLAHFIRVYLAVSRLIRTPDDLAMIFAAFARQQVSQGVLYTEATFTAMAHVRNGMEPVALWAAVRDGLADIDSGTEIRLIIDAQRDLGSDDARDNVRLVENADAPIVGLGLSGPEGEENDREFVVLRQAADRLHLGLAVHAGEEGPPDQVRAALDDLGADRIAHGVAAAKAPDLIERLKRDAVPLDMCLSSNVGIGIFPSLEAHPFADLWRAGLNVNLSSDDPPFLSTTLIDELRHAARLASLSRADLADLQRRAALAAFAPADTRGRLVAAIDAWTDRHRSCDGEARPSQA